MFPIVKKFASDRGGNVLVEFAVAMPVLLLLVLGSVEMGRYILLNQKLHNAAATMADLTARFETLSAAQVDNLFAATGQLVNPFDLDTNGRVIVSGVSAAVPNDPRVFWQRSGGGSYSATSQVGAVGGTAAVDTGLPVRVGETVIVAEIFYHYEPFLLSLVDESVMWRIAYVRPRLGTLQTLN